MSHEQAFIVLVFSMALVALGLAVAVVTIMGGHEQTQALFLAVAGRAPGSAAQVARPHHRATATHGIEKHIAGFSKSGWRADCAAMIGQAAQESSSSVDPAAHDGSSFAVGGHPSRDSSER